ncbi:melanocyte-stimulating hormone receptor-like [Orbicella faveolata]|uniref:melanocyte-stimulating hormone receptor-like n=1 Tax=Orbicella faveolata TaxID=48498 RepID=UPI0009E3720B|nr:melanocyte-stimulating hormone receptor-like [Orbicella faveolata]
MPNESKTNFSCYSDIENENSGLETIVIINCVLNAPLMILAISGNALVLVAVLRAYSLFPPSVTLLCSLAMSDLLVGLVVQPLYIANALTENSTLKQALNTTVFVVCGVSLLTMAVISVDRFLALHHHMRYPELMTTHRAIFTTATLWIIVFLLSFLNFWTINAYYLASAVSILICLLVSTVSYIKIYFIVKHHHLQIHTQQQAVESNATDINQTMLRSTKSAKNTFIYYTVMISCYTPVFVAMAILFISPSHWNEGWTFADTVVFMNSSINPVLYCWRLRQLRTAVVKIVRQLLGKQTEEN